MPPDEQKRHYALQAKETNEKAVARYMDLLRDGYTEDDARSVVKDAFNVGDTRLDRALTSRAGSFSPSTISELEAKALTHIGRIDLDVGRMRRFYEKQIDDIELEREAGVDTVTIEIIEQVGGKFEGVKYKKIPIAEAERKLLEALVQSNQPFLDALKAMKVDTIINIKADNIHSQSTAELERELEIVRAKRVTKSEGEVG